MQYSQLLESLPVRQLHERLTEARKAKWMTIADVARAMPEVGAENYRSSAFA